MATHCLSCGARHFTGPAPTVATCHECTPPHHLNSFQKWADDYGRAFGFQVTPFANWVILSRDGVDHECMTAQGVQAVCAHA